MSSGFLPLPDCSALDRIPDYLVEGPFRDLSGTQGLLNALSASDY